MNTTITPKQLLDRLHWRYAVKKFDPSRRIPGDIWDTLEEALVLTPSSGGLQPWTFVVVDDPAVRQKLVPASYGQTKVAEASHLVVFAARTNFSEADVDAHIARSAEVTGAAPADLVDFRNMLAGFVAGKDPAARAAWAARQTTIALGNLLTSAALLGIDACPMEGFAPDQYDALLGLDKKGLTAVSLCVLGYRADDDAYAKSPKVRFPRGKIIIHI